MTDRKPRRSVESEPDEEKAYLSDQYWLKYLDPQDFEAVQIGDETESETRERRNKYAIMGAYRDALKTRSEEEALAFVMEAIKDAQINLRFAEWSKEQGGDIPF